MVGERTEEEEEGTRLRGEKRRVNFEGEGRTRDKDGREEELEDGQG